MMQALLDTSTRTRIASLLYKLAIRVMKVSKRPLDPSRALLALDHARKGNVKKLIAAFTPSDAVGSIRISKIPSVQKVLAARTFVPAQGEGIRVDLVFGPLFLLESRGELGAISKKSVSRPGLPPEGLIPLEKLEAALSSTFGGILPQTKLITSDVRDLSDRPFSIEHSYDQESGGTVWKVVHAEGAQKGQVAFHENPKVVSQLEKDPSLDLDPWRPAVFKSAEEAAQILNQLTRGTSLSSRNFPKFKEYTVYFKYSAVYLATSAADSALYNSFDRLLSEADTASEESSALSALEKKELVTKALEWIKDKEATPAALLSTMEAKNPAMAKQLKQVLPDIYAALSAPPKANPSKVSDLKEAV